MYVDAITLAAVADEWRALLIGARIDTVIQPTEHSIAMQCYAPGGEGERNRWLYCSTHPQLARVHLTARKPPRIASEPPPFVMLLRKHLEGTRIEAVQQPRWERVIEVIASRPASPGSAERVRYRLIVEIMGRLSNIILVDEQNLILGSLKRVDAAVNRYRTIAPNLPYVPPPPQQRAFADQLLPKLEPTTITAAQLMICAAEEMAARPPAADNGARKSRKRAAPDLLTCWQLLSRHLLGFSPLIAREAVYRTTGDAEYAVEDRAELWEELAWNVRDLSALYDTHTWRPQMAERIGDGKGQSSSQAFPIAFAPYVLEQYAGQPGLRVRAFPSINALLDDYYAHAEWRDAMEHVRAPIRKVLQTQRERCLRKAEILQRELANIEDAAQYRVQGELLLAHQHEIERGQSSVALPDFASLDADQPALITVPLDPRFDAVENANRQFNKYHKLRRASALVPEQVEQNATELATIEQLLTDLALAETPAEVNLVKAEVQTAGYLRGKPQEKKAQKQGKKSGKSVKGKPMPPGGGVPLHVQSRDGFTILIGKNSRQNEEVTFRQASSNDLWLHARGVPGAHVIIKAAGRDIPRGTIEQAAALAAWYSQARGSTSAPVDYTLQRHVRHMKGGGPGMVVYEREKTIYVEPSAFS
jgi:predicted ribosome quality control (RQC) complex YloA/Tae2 family protein